MRVVLDTNILVSALLKPQSLPAKVLDALVSQQFILLWDHRIMEEYREVLRRPKFKIDKNLVDELLALLDSIAEYIVAQPLDLKVKDVDDLPFIEVALTGKADVLVTGNLKHFREVTEEFKVLTAHQFLGMLQKK